MIEDMEAELTESSEINSKTDNLAGNWRGRCWWSHPNLSKKEWKTQAYQKIMNINIENIKTFEKRIRKKQIQLNGGQSTKL